MYICVFVILLFYSNHSYFTFQADVDFAISFLKISYLSISSFVYFAYILLND